MLSVLYRGLPFDKSVIHTVESVVIEWSHQIRDVLKKSSAQPLLDGKNPGPMVEIDFWKARNTDLQSVYEQVGEKQYHATSVQFPHVVLCIKYCVLHVYMSVM